MRTIGWILTGTILAFSLTSWAEPNRNSQVEAPPWIETLANELTDRAIELSDNGLNFKQRSELHRLAHEFWVKALLANKFINSSLMGAASAYPDVVVFDLLNRAFSMTFMQWFFWSVVGSWEAGILWAASPATEILSASYLGFRMWRKQVVYQKTYGLTRRQAREFSAQFLNSLRFQPDSNSQQIFDEFAKQAENLQFSSVLIDTFNSPRVNRQRLENAVGDRSFVASAQRLAPSEFIYHMMMVEKILRDTSAQERFFQYLRIHPEASEVQKQLLELRLERERLEAELAKDLHQNWFLNKWRQLKAGIGIRNKIATVQHQIVEILALEVDQSFSCAARFR